MKTGLKIASSLLALSVIVSTMAACTRSEAPASAPAPKAGDPGKPAEQKEVTLTWSFGKDATGVSPKLAKLFEEKIPASKSMSWSCPPNPMPSTTITSPSFPRRTPASIFWTSTLFGRRNLARPNGCYVSFLLANQHIVQTAGANQQNASGLASFADLFRKLYRDLHQAWLLFIE